MVVCRDQFGARDSWLNNLEHWSEDMYCPRALLKFPGSRTTFFYALRTALGGRSSRSENDDSEDDDVYVLGGSTVSAAG